MTRRSTMAGALVLALVAVHGTRAHAQWGYPGGGFGDFGWGGWGASTAEGDLARGLGAFAQGAGFYNYKTAHADAINLDTVIKWNEHIYEAQRQASRLHHARIAERRLNNRNQRDAIRQRLRDNPESADIHRGDALNVALDEINDPRASMRRLPASRVKVGGEMIRNIPFQKAAAAITVSIYQLVDGGAPAPLLRPEFATEMAAVKKLGQELRAQIEADQEPSPAAFKNLLAAIGHAEAKATEVLPRNSRERNESVRYLKALHGLIGMLNTPAIDVILAGVDKRPDTSLGELLAVMNAFSLRFGSATTPQQRMVYDALYPKLVALRTEANALVAAAAAAPDPGNSAVENFFAPMSIEDLQKTVPVPGSPAK